MRVKSGPLSKDSVDNTRPLIGGISCQII